MNSLLVLPDVLLFQLIWAAIIFTKIDRSAQLGLLSVITAPCGSITPALIWLLGGDRILGAAVITLSHFTSIGKVNFC